MPTYEMFWDCDACGTTKLLGKTHRHCPNCGSVQDPAARYFPAEHEKVLVRDHVFHGVDWSCERCDTPNSAAASHCTNCGDARDGSESDVKRRRSVHAGTQSGKLEDEGFESSGPSAEALELEDDLSQLQGGNRKVQWALFAAIAIALVLGSCCIFSIFWTEPTTVTVTDHTWQRDILIERLSARQDGAWCDSMPSDAYGVSRSRQQRSTRSIPDGESCGTVNVDNGDGTFSTRTECHTTYREEPVYDDYCDYTVDRWGHDHTNTSKGQGLDDPPYWPSYSVSDCGSLGCTRVGARRESYYVHFVDADDTPQQCDFDQKQWGSMPVGTRWAGRKQVIWDNLVCSGLEPEGKKKPAASGAES